MKNKYLFVVLFALLLAADVAGQKQILKTSKGVTEEMLNAEYWISKTPNAGKIIMTSEQIALYNSEIKSSLIAADEWMFDLQNMAANFTPEIKAKNIKTFRDEIIEDYFYKEDFFVKGEKVGKDFWKPFVENMNFDVEPNADFDMGIVVRKTNLRHCPSDQHIGDSLVDIECDAMMNTGVLINEPILLLHTSADGKWFFAMTYFATGWIHREDVALCKDFDSWMEAQKFDDFIIVTANKFNLEADPFCPAVSELPLYMGTKLKLASQDACPKIIGNRSVYNNYVVQIPVRAQDGTLGYEYALVSPAKGVSRGYLPYTTANILKLAFQCLGDRYGWGGQFNSRDCSQFTMEIFRCFGIDLPRNSGTQSKIAGKEIAWQEGTPSAQRTKDLKKIPVGAILRIPGHVMLYLGLVKNTGYCISASGIIMSDDMSEEIFTKTVMVSTLGLKRKNGKTWLENLTHAKFVRK